ncbi:MAG: hypothetical protein GY909_15460 [Oligoflexia bacterium]|nr:hypothetical protein [Oligoflexia bacterium]
MSWVVVYSEERNDLRIAERTKSARLPFRTINFLKTVTKKNKYVPVGSYIFSMGRYLDTSYVEVGKFS